MNVANSFKHTCSVLSLSCCIGLLTLSSFSYQASLHAECHHCQDDALKLGIELETNFWNLVKRHEVHKFSKKLAPIFQGLSINGVFTREQQIDSLARITLIGFKIENPRATCSGNVLVFSYDFIADGIGLTNGPTTSVWKKYHHAWRMINHSFVPFVE
jgi:hypothetical protein